MVVPLPTKSYLPEPTLLSPPNITVLVRISTYFSPTWGKSVFLPIDPERTRGLFFNQGTLEPQLPVSPDFSRPHPIPHPGMNYPICMVVSGLTYPKKAVEAK
jgi:hypothetical protein